MELWTSLQVSIICPDIILLELVFHFLLVTSSWLEGSASMMSLHLSYHSLSLNCHHLFFGTSLHSSLLVGDYVCGLSYKSNAFAWLEHFIRNIHTGKYLCINIWLCNYFSQYNIHPYLTELSRCFPSLPGQHWDCALIQYVSKEVSFYISSNGELYSTMSYLPICILVVYCH